MTAISVVPPPMSQIALPRGSEMGKPAPMAAASGSSMSHACYEVGDDPLTHRAYDLDGVRGAADHLERLPPDREDARAVAVDRHQ